MTSPRQLMQSHPGTLKGSAIDAEDQRIQEVFKSAREQASVARHEKQKREAASFELANWMGWWQRDLMDRRRRLQTLSMYTDIAAVLCGLMTFVAIWRCTWPG